MGHRLPVLTQQGDTLSLLPCTATYRHGSVGALVARHEAEQADASRRSGQGTRDEERRENV